MTGLWVPPGAERTTTQFRKSPAPKVGPQYGSWAGRDLSYLNLPGGSVVQFDLSKLTLADYRQMREHYQVNMSLSVLMFMMHQQEWSIKCADQNVANTIDEVLRPVWTKLIRSISQAYWCGFSPTVVEYDNEPITGRVIISKFKDLVPEESRVNWLVVEGASPLPDSAPPRLFEYDGIVQWSWGTGYATDGSSRAAGGGNYVIDPQYTLWYPLMMENGDYYGRKLLKAAFVPWFYSILIHLFSNRYFERFGEPTPVGRADFNADLVDSNGAAIGGRDAMFAILENLRSRGVVVLPNDSTDMGNGRREYDFDIKYLESQMRGADFERYLLRLDEEISLGIFTPISITRVGENATKSATETHMLMYMWMLNAFSGDLKEYIDAFVIDRIKQFNFGPNAPKAEWIPRQFGKDNAETLRAIVAGGMTAGSIKPNVEQLGVAVGIDFEEVQVMTAPIAAPGASSQAGADTRVNRQKPSKPGKPGGGDPGSVRSKIQHRVASQVDRAKREDRSEFVADLGFRREVEDVVGDPDAVADIYRRMGLWASDAYGVAKTAAEFTQMFERVLESELPSPT